MNGLLERDSISVSALSCKKYRAEITKSQMTLVYEILFLRMWLNCKWLISDLIPVVFMCTYTSKAGQPIWYLSCLVFSCPVNHESHILGQNKSDSLDRSSDKGYVDATQGSLRAAVHKISIVIIINLSIPTYWLPNKKCSKLLLVWSKLDDCADLFWIFSVVS